MSVLDELREWASAPYSTLEPAAAAGVLALLDIAEAASHPDLYSEPQSEAQYNAFVRLRAALARLTEGGRAS